MRRRLCNLAAGVSLMLCVAVVMLWVRSHWRHDLLTLNSGHWDSCRISSGRGTIGVVFDVNEITGPLPENAVPKPRGIEFRSLSGRPHDLSRAFIDDPLIERRLFGYGYVLEERVARAGRTRIALFIFPHWFLVCIATLPAAVWLRVWRRERARSRIGLCPSCGYDLRATPERCPECGMEAKRQPAEGAAA